MLFGALLNADGLRKGATSRDAGVARDVSLALTEPLEDVSHAVFLDRPRRWLKQAVGREGDDRIDVTISAREPATPKSRSQSRSRARPAVHHDLRRVGRSSKLLALKRRFSTARPLRLWIAGDSMAEVPGLAILRATGHNAALQAVGDRVRSRLGTGLGRPDIYDWFTAIPEAVRELHPDVVVLALGGNDFHSYMSGTPGGVSIGAFRSVSWNREYRRRVGILLDAITRLGSDVVWLGLPMPTSTNMRPRFAALDALIRAEVAERPAHVVFLDTSALLSDHRGRAVQYLANASGKLDRIRADDGLHLAPAGGNRVAAAFVRLLGERYDIQSWRRTKH
jgi:hypothetical protein